MYKPDYKRIYSDMIDEKFPEKRKDLQYFFDKENWTSLDIIRLEKKLFPQYKLSAEHRSYDKSTILEILEYQKKHQYNNSQLAAHFKVSRNTIAKWKKIFL